MACDIADLLKTIARGVHWRSKMSTDSFMLALAAAASPLLQDHDCFKLFLVYFACCEFQVRRLKAAKKRATSAPNFFFTFENPLLEALLHGTPIVRHLHWSYLANLWFITQA